MVEPGIYSDGDYSDDDSDDINGHDFDGDKDDNSVSSGVDINRHNDGVMGC